MFQKNFHNFPKFHAFCSNSTLLYCSRGEEGAWTSHRNCKTRGKGTSHKVLHPSSTKQTTSWEESKDTVTAIPLTPHDPAALSGRTVWDGKFICFLSKSARLPGTLLVWSVYKMLRMNWHKKCQLLVSVPGLLLHCNLHLVLFIGLASQTFQAAILWTGITAWCQQVFHSIHCRWGFLIPSWHQHHCWFTVDVSTMLVFLWL